MAGNTPKRRRVVRRVRGELRPQGRKKAEARAQADQQLLLAITRTQALFIDEAQPARLFEVLLEELLALTNSAYGFIGEVERIAEGQPFLRIHAMTDIAWNEDTKALMAQQATMLELHDLKTLFGRVMTTGKPVIVNDPAHDPRAGGLPPGHPPMHALLGLPFFHGGVMTGMVGVANRPGGYDEMLVAYLQPLLGTCGQLVEGFCNKRFRTEAEQALRVSEDRFRVAMQGANDGIWDWDLRTNQVYFSERWKNMLGYEDHEIADVYSEWESRLHPDDHACVLSGLTSYLQHQQDAYAMEFRLRKKDDTYCWIHARGKAVWDVEGRPYRMAGSHVDITEQKREEALQAAQIQVLELVAKGQALNDVLASFCRTFEACAAPMLCSVMLVTEDGAHLSSAAGPSLPDEYNRLVQNIPIGPNVGSCGSAAFFRKPVIATDIATDPSWKDYASVPLAYGLKACWSQPIVNSTGVVLGTFAAYHRTPRSPQPDELKIVERASHIAALAIQHARMTDALRESEARFQAFMRHSPAVTFIKDAVGRHVYVNAQFESVFGLSREAVKDKTVFDFMPADVAAELHRNDQSVLSSGQTRETEEAVPTLDGKATSWLVVKFPLELGHRRLLGGMAFDITERKKLERASQDQADRLRLAMDIARLATWEWNILTNQVIWSDNCEAVKGLPRGSFDGTFEAYQRLVHPEDLPKLLADIEGALNGQQPYYTEHRIVPPTGEVQWVEGNGVVYRDELGRPIRMVGTVRNVSARKRIEMAMRVNEERYARATAVGRVGVWELDVQAGTYHGDRNLKAMFGYQPNELSADPLAWLNLVHPDDQSVAMDHWQRIVRREAEDYNYELRMIRKDGAVIWTNVRGQAVRTADGQLTHLIGATLDITARRQAEDNLLRTQFAMDHAVDAVYWIDPQARVLYTNAVASAMLGYTKEEFLRMTVHDLNPDFPAEMWPGWWEEMREKKVMSLETVHKTKNGRRIPIDICVTFLAYGSQEFHCAFVRDISKRKEVEEAAYRSLTLLQSVLHTAPIRVFWKDCASRFLGCNQLFAFDAGCTDAQQIVGKTDAELAWHEQAALYQADDRQVMESGCAKLDFEEPGTTRDGQMVWLRTSKVPLRDEQGSVIGVLGVYEDITERKRSEQALQESQERFELAAKASNDGIWDWNILTGEQYWSDRHLELFGLERNAFIPTYDAWIALVHPDDADWVHQATQQHLNRREPYDIEVRVKIKDGSYRWFRDRGQAVWDTSGRPVRMVGSITDVTQRRQAEEAIWNAHAELEQRVTERTAQLAQAIRLLQEEIAERKRVEARLRTTQYAVDHAADQIFVIGSDGVLLDVNESACRRLGYTKEELLRMSVMDLDPDFPPAAWDEYWARLTRAGQLRLETRHRSKSGEIYPVEVMANYLCHDGQELDYAVVRDITDRRQAETALRESELRYKLLTEATFDGIAIHDQGTLLEVNRGLERMFGYESGQLVGRPLWDLVADESRDLALTNMRNGVNGPYEVMGRRKDGSTFPGEVVIRSYRYRDKDVRLVAGRDITERKHLERERSRYTAELERQIAERTAEIARLESQRVQTDRLAALGRLAAGVAHEINNPIAGIKNAFELVKQAVDPGHEQYEFVGLIDREIARVSLIVQNMYQLYRRESGKMEVVDLRTMIGDIEALFAKQLQQRQLTLVVEAAPEVDRLDAPRSDLLQVLLNLLNNAMDCSREGGTITISIREEAQVIRIAVADHGAGIAPEILPHIFDPFFTTKTGGEQKGMGLGLSISQSLVAAMGGRIDVHTQLGQGSTFSVLLPCHRVVASMPDPIHTNKEVITHGC